ncbi:MAG TPA: hypothetical protein P5124_06270 [Syntrophorhabdaceae bacterium]|nr:hypothetical protein [Syntrophorhabdaceae bacterium]
MQRSSFWNLKAVFVILFTSKKLLSAQLIVLILFQWAYGYL